MAIAFRAIGATSKVQSGNLASVGLPAGHALNDILLLFTNQQDNVVSTVSGYTNIAGGTANNGTNDRIMLFAKRDNGSESAPTVTHAAGGITNAAIVALSGVDSGLTIGVGAGAIFRDAQNQTGNNGTTFTAPALTGVVSGDFRIFFGGFTVSDTSGATTNNWGTVTGFTERLDDCSDLAGAWGVSLGIDTLLATGSAGSVTSTVGWTGSTVTTSPQFWTWICAQLALSSDASGGASPFVNGDWPNPNAKKFPVDLRGYTDGSEIWLFAGKDVQFRGAGQWQTYDYPNPTLKRDDVNRRTWTDSYKLTLIGRDTFFRGQGHAPNYDWPNPTLKLDDINRRTWLDVFKQLLIGKDTFFRGAGQAPSYDWPNPTTKRDDVNRRWHWWNPLQQLLSIVIVNPFALLDWQNPLRARPKHQDHQGAYTLGLIGQDSLPFDQTDWPVPKGQAPLTNLRTWIDSFKFTLIGQDALPFRLLDWMNPWGRKPKVQDHTGSYTLPLIGQDTFFGPPGIAPDYDYPNPQLPRRGIDLRTHLWNPLQTLLNIIVAAPFAMLDWPNPLRRVHPHQGSVDTFKQLLIGQDKLPFRLSEWPNPIPKTFSISLRGFFDGLRRWLPIPISAPPGRITPADYSVGTLTMADLSAKVLVVDLALNRMTVTDAVAPIAPSDMPAGTVKLEDKAKN